LGTKINYNASLFYILVILYQTHAAPEVIADIPINFISHC